MRTITIAGAELPALAGSEKQVAWAEQLRGEDIAWVNQGPAYLDSDDPFVDRFLNRFPSAETKEDDALLRTLLAAAIREHFAQTEARYWIDNRTRTPEDMAYAAVHPAFMAHKRAAMIAAHRARKEAGTITPSQQAHLERLLAHDQDH